MTHFPQGFYILCSFFQGFIVVLSFNHWGKSSIGRADSTIIPVADKISPYHCLEFICGHFFCFITVIHQLRFHSGPHALAAGVVVTSPSCAVHALPYAIFADCIPVNLTSILAPSVTVDDRSPDVWICFNGIFQCLYA